MRAVIDALQALRGIALVSAVPIAAEVGALSRFAKPRQLMGYSGAVSSEDSTGRRIRRGTITKTGNAHLRRVVIEAAWAYRYRPAVGAVVAQAPGVGQPGCESHVLEVYAAALRARPALLVRGSSPRITIMRCRPADIRVINRRDSRLGHHRCCAPSSLTMTTEKNRENAPMNKALR